MDSRASSAYMERDMSFYEPGSNHGLVLCKYGFLGQRYECLYGGIP